MDPPTLGKKTTARMPVFFTAASRSPQYFSEGNRYFIDSLAHLRFDSFLLSDATDTERADRAAEAV